MGKPSGEDAQKKEILKQVIKELHQGAEPEKVKERFKEVIADTTPIELARIEEELVKEGIPQEEIHRLCDIHLAVFQESMEKERAVAPPGHPVHILTEEHKMVLNFADGLQNVAKEIKGAGDYESAGEQMRQLEHLIKHFKESESHYLREENVLFPYLEKHGITQPPAIMWIEHDKIREMEKGLYEIIDAHKSIEFKDFVKQLEETSLALAEMLASHFTKENNILFPSALKVISEDEFKEIRHQFDEIGYCCFTPKPATISGEEFEETSTRPEVVDQVSFPSGSLSKEELEAIFNSLPVDITFVGADDTVRFFSESKERIFVRTKAIIGREVQKCHPQKSIHVVKGILEDFKSGKKDVAEFWINLEGRLIYIRYFPVRSEDGSYLGCLEVSQDITDIKKIEGEKRLL